MGKKYIVRLSGKERGLLLEIVKKLKGTSQKVRRANILLKADANQDKWPDKKIAEAFSCRVYAKAWKLVEYSRERIEFADSSVHLRASDCGYRTA